VRSPRQFRFFAAVPALLAALSGLPAAHAQQVERVEVVWAGTYGVNEIQELDDPTAPTGRRFVSGGVQPLLDMDRIPAEIGTRFGIGYVLKGEPEGGIVEASALWRFPARGITNPETRTTLYEWRMPLRNCPIERKPFCLIGYPLQHAWELVPGRWTIEVWAEGRKLAEKSFELYVP
jgi:uncharacterized protein DUF3859